MVTLRIRQLFCALAVGVASCVVTSSALAAPPVGWTAVDLGTLAGSGQSHAVAINASGEIVGDSDAASGLPHGFRWTTAGGMVDLGTLPGGTYSYAVDVNASGQVAGYGDTSTGIQHAIRWSATGVATDLGDLGGSDSTAVAINDAGTVAGTSTTATFEQHAFSRTTTGAMVDLGTLGGGYSSAVAINASGQVTGSSFISATTGEEHAFLYTPGAAVPMADAGTSTFTSRAMGINNAGAVVGFRTPDGNAPGQTGFLRSGGLTLIGTASSFTSANAINASGQIVGTEAAGDAGVQQAFSRSTAGVVTAIPTLGGSFGVAYGVNTGGAVIGSSLITDDAANHAFFWTAAGGLLDLSTIGGSDSYADAVNDSDMTVGWSSNVDGDTHATLWQRAVATDTTPPVVTANIKGALGADGWYTGDVTIGWTVADLESAITSAPCVGSTVTTDTAGTTFTCTATSTGGSTTQSITIRRRTPAVAGVTPTITATATPTATVIPKARSLRVSTSLSPKLKAGRQSVLVTLQAPIGSTASGMIQLKAKLTAGKKAKLKNVGSKAFKLGSGQKKTFTIVLSKTGKARLVTVRNLRVSVIIGARDAAGKTKPTTRGVTIKATKVKS
jgi:probable HAF family extracellular repeat protein